MTRTRAQCETEIMSTYAAYQQAEAAGDQLGADAEELVLNELLEEYGRLKQVQQRRPVD